MTHIRRHVARAARGDVQSALMLTMLTMLLGVAIGLLLAWLGAS